MLDYAVSIEETTKQIQAMKQKIESRKQEYGINELSVEPETWPGNHRKDCEENKRKDEELIKSCLAERNAEIEKYIHSDEYKEIRRKELEIYEENERRATKNEFGFGKIARKPKIQEPKKNNTPQKLCLVSDNTIQRKKQSGDDYFMMTKRGIIRNKEYRKIFKGPGTVYAWLWANLVRSEWIDTKGYPIKKRYYENGYLAYSSSYRQIGEDCFLHKNKVKEHIDAFKEAGIIKVEHLTPNGKKRGQSVFVLGEWKNINGKIEETFYKDEIFSPREDGQNVPV